jgi:hypothetical protein
MDKKGKLYRIFKHAGIGILYLLIFIFMIIISTTLPDCYDSSSLSDTSKKTIKNLYYSIYTIDIISLVSVVVNYFLASTDGQGNATDKDKDSGLYLCWFLLCTNFSMFVCVCFLLNTISKDNFCSDIATVGDDDIKKCKTLCWVMIFMLLIALGVGLYLLWKYYEKMPEEIIAEANKIASEVSNYKLENIDQFECADNYKRSIDILENAKNFVENNTREYASYTRSIKELNRFVRYSIVHDNVNKDVINKLDNFDTLSDKYKHIQQQICNNKNYKDEEKIYGLELIRKDKNAKISPLDCAMVDQKINTDVVKISSELKLKEEKAMQEHEREQKELNDRAMEIKARESLKENLEKEREEARNLSEQLESVRKEKQKKQRRLEKQNEEKYQLEPQVVEPQLVKPQLVKPQLVEPVIEPRFDKKRKLDEPEQRSLSEVLQTHSQIQEDNERFAELDL